MYFPLGPESVVACQETFFVKLSGRAEEISIQFNTNGLAIQDKSKESWNRLKKVGFNLSCDGIGAVNEYVRWPGKWSKWERNMNKLKTWRKELGKINWENIA